MREILPTTMSELACIGSEAQKLGMIQLWQRRDRIEKQASSKDSGWHHRIRQLC